MTIQNPATRQRMAKCFKEAAQYLWSGNGAYADTPGCRYICFTFESTSASVATRQACERIIANRLGSCASVEEWLEANKCIPRHFNESDLVGSLWPGVQAFRKAWLLKLAEEFSQPPESKSCPLKSLPNKSTLASMLLQVVKTGNAMEVRNEI